MIINILIFIAGLILLVKGSDFFVKSAASIAEKLGVSEFVIGLTLVALGTSIPELASSVIASLKNQSGIVIGNVVGSNIANIGLIIGVAATIAVIKTKEDMLKRDGYIMLFAALLFYVFALNSNISKLESIIFIILYFAYILFLIELKPELGEKYHFNEFIKYFFKFQYIFTIKDRLMSKANKENKITRKQKTEIKQLFKEALIKDLLISAIAGAAVVFGAKYLVQEAVFFAKILNIPQTFIGISIIALGTSLPELSVSISAARKGYGNIAIGNVIGSNIANIFLVIGIS